MPSSVSSPNAAAHEHREASGSGHLCCRRWPLVASAIEIALGCLGVLILFSLPLVDVFFIGVLLPIAGGAQLTTTFVLRGTPVRTGWLAIGALYILGGLAILLDPLLDAAETGYIVAGVLLAAGLVRLAATRHSLHGGGRVALILTGGIAIVLAVMFGISGTTTGPYWAALFLAFEMILQGLCGFLLRINASPSATAFTV